MFGLGWGEMVVVGIVALIVVGPKDLPVLFRQAGKMMGKARGMAREFTSAMNAAADDAGVGDISKSLKDPVAGVSDSMTEWAGFDDMEDERKEMSRKIHDATLKSEAKKRSAEAEVLAEKADAAKAAKKPATKAKAAKTPAAKKPAVKKPAAKKPATKTPASKTPAAKKDSA